MLEPGPAASRRALRRPILGTLAGAALGCGYYVFFGCDSGCAMQSNPLLTVVLGAAMGFVATGNR